MKVGDLVFVKQDDNKHTTQEKYLVTALNQDHLWAKKLTGSHFRAKTYELKYCDVYFIPTSQVPLCPNKSSDPYASDTSSDDVSIPLTTDPTHSDFGDSSEVTMPAGTNAQPSTSGSNYPACNEHVDPLRTLTPCLLCHPRAAPHQMSAVLAFNGIDIPQNT